MSLSITVAGGCLRLTQANGRVGRALSFRYRFSATGAGEKGA
jgi:hypothetical protein